MMSSPRYMWACKDTEPKRERTYGHMVKAAMSVVTIHTGMSGVSDVSRTVP